MRSTGLLISTVLVLASTLLSAQKAVPEHTKIKTAATAPANFKLSGSPSAPILLELFTDYECPSCRMLYMEVLPLVQQQYIATGKVRLLHRDFPLPMHKYTRVATKYANAAGLIGRYELVAGEIFRMQQEWSQNGDVDGVVAKVLTPAEMQKVRDLVKNDTHLDDTVTADLAIGNQDNLGQTPTMIIVAKGKRNKIEGPVPFTILKSYLDQILAKN